PPSPGLAGVPLLDDAAGGGGASGAGALHPVISSADPLAVERDGDVDGALPGHRPGLLGEPPAVAGPFRRRHRRAVARAGADSAGDGAGTDPGQPGPPADPGRGWGPHRALLPAPRAGPAAGPAIPAAQPGASVAGRRGRRLVRLPRRRAPPPGAAAGVSVRAAALLD